MPLMKRKPKKMKDAEADMLDSAMPKKMADGGEVREDLQPYMPSQEEQDNSGLPPGKDRAAYMAAKKKSQAEGGSAYAHGGMVERPSSIAQAVMQKRKASMSEGGEVDSYDEQNYEAAMKENYEEDLFPEVPGSDEIGDSEEESRESKLGMVQSIRAKLKAKRGF